MTQPGGDRHSIGNVLSSISSNSNQKPSGGKRRKSIVDQINEIPINDLKQDFRLSVSGMESQDWRRNKDSLVLQRDMFRDANGLSFRLICKFECQNNCTALFLLSGCLLKDQSQVVTAASQAVSSWGEMATRNPRPMEKEGLKNVSVVLVELVGSASKLSGSCASESMAKMGHSCLQSLALAAGRHSYIHGIEKFLVEIVDKTVLKNESRMIALSESLATILSECSAAPALLNMKKKGSLMVGAVKECIEHKNQDVRNNGMAAYAKMSKRKEFCPLADAVILSVGHKYRERLVRYS